MLFKLHLTTILSLALVVCANAGWVKDLHILHYENSNGEKGRTVFIYNGKELPYKAIWELKDGSRWSENLHTFNRRRQLIHKERSFSDSLHSEQSFTYSKEGLLLHESFSRSDGVKGTAHYTYKGDRCIEVLCDNHLGWFSGKILYYYGLGGRMDSARLEIKGQQIGRIEYRYDPMKRLEQETWTFSRGFQQIFRYEYLDRNCIVYQSSSVFLNNSCACLIEKEDYDFNGQGGGPSHYRYNEAGALLEKTFIREDGLKTITSYSYDDSGLLLGSMRTYNDGSVGNFTYRYNPERKLTERQFFIGDSLSGREVYSYDEQGKLVSGLYENFDGWLTGRLEFYHDRYDRISRARYKSMDKSDATLQFTYDEVGHLIRILWEFDQGYTQTYKFSYRCKTH